MNISEILNIFEISSTLFYKIVDISIKASVVGIIGLFLIKVLKAKISPKYEYLIGLIFIVILIVPIKINYKFNINIIPTNIKNDFSENYLITKGQENYFINYLNNNILDDNFYTQKFQVIYSPKLIIKYLIFVIFLLLVFIKSIVFIIVNFNLKKSLKNANSKDERILSILENYKKKLNINRKIKIAIRENTEVPSIFGIIDVKILLPKSVYELTDREIEYIICHELYHYKRKDNIILPIISILEIVYIFNPIVMICLREIKNTMEYAVDEKLMLLFDTEEDKINYCSTLVKMACNDYIFNEFVNCFSSKTIILHRIRRLKNKRKNYKVLYIFMVLFIVLAIGFIVYTVSETLSLNNFENLVYNGTLNNENIELSFEYSNNIMNDFAEDTNTSYINGKFWINLLYVIFNNIDKTSLNYKYLGNEIYNSKECSIISIYSKTLNSFVSEDVWIDIETGEILKEEEYYNTENGIKPNTPINILKYTYSD
jgi:bla regulator protein BlaR1